MVQPLWRTVWRFLRKLQIEIPYDPAIPLLDIYLEKLKTLIQKYTCTPMFIAALFITAKTWECSLTDEWIKKVWCVYTHTHTHTHTFMAGILLSHKNNEIMSFAGTWVDLQVTIPSEVRQRKTNII